MDNKLPTRPSLEQLRKQAKELKDSGQHPTLSDAQFTLARHYGFPSWPKLRLAVEQDTLTRLMVEGNYDAMRKLLKASPKLVSTASTEGNYPLHQAAESDDPVLVDILVEHGAPLQTKWQDSAHTALSWAVTVGAQHSALRLIHHGVQPDLFTAAGLGLLDYVKLFWDGDKLKGPASTTGSTRFTESGEPLPYPPPVPQDQVSDALYVACRNGRLEVSEWLLDHGADPNWRGYCGANSLAWAEYSDNRELCNLLLARGADPHMKDFSFRAEPRLFALMVLAGWGFPSDLLRKRIEVSPELVYARGDYGTLLNAAAWNGQLETAKVLLEFGADREARNAAGLTALDVAKDRGFPELVELLST
ncbi:MAG: ankyrin repeat domain-containing protein [Chlorobia bacterium]|nr:ankyrin repeat domain-containing protein [Fimbriimonadaceae bacterium]